MVRVLKYQATHALMNINLQKTILDLDLRHCSTDSFKLNAAYEISVSEPSGNTRAPSSTETRIHDLFLGTQECLASGRTLFLHSKAVLPPYVKRCPLLPHVLKFTNADGYSETFFPL